MNKHRIIIFYLVLLTFSGCSKMSRQSNPNTPASTLSVMGHSPMAPFTIQVASKFTIETKGVVYDLAWSPDGSLLASSSYGRVNLWDGAGGFLIDYLIGGEGNIWDLEWTEDGEKLAITGDTNASSIWEKGTGTLTKIPSQLMIKSTSWSPAGSQIALGLCVQRFEVLDLETQTIIISGSTIHGVWGIDWSPDGQTIATAEFDGYIKVWDAETGDLLRTYHSGWMGTNAYSVAWSPDGQMLASAHRDGRVRIWALDNNEDEPYQILEKQRGWVSTVVWSPDGRMLVSTHGLGEADDYFIDYNEGGKSEGGAYLWDMRSGTLLAVLEESSPVPIWSAAWSPDGRFIALGEGLIGNAEDDTQITVWEVR